MNSGNPRRWSGLVILALILALTGCASGGGGISVGTGLDVAEAEALPVAEAAASLVIAADPLAELARRWADETRWTASAGGEVSAFDAAGVAAAPVAERDVKLQVLERWPGGRVRVLRVIESAERGPIASAETKIVFRYGSAPTSPDDLNDTPPPTRGGPHAFVRAAIEGDWVARRPDGGQFEGGRTEGLSLTHSDPEIDEASWDITTTAPSGVLPFESRRQWGMQGQRAASAVYGLEVRLADGAVDRREVVVDGAGGKRALSYTRTYPDGTTASGRGTVVLPARCAAVAEATAAWVVTPADERRPVRGIEAVQGEDGGERTETLRWPDGRQELRRFTWTRRIGDLCDPSATVELAHVAEGEGLPTVQGVERRRGRFSVWEGVAEGGEGAWTWSATARADGASVRVEGVAGGGTAAVDLQLGPHGGGKGTWTPADGRARPLARAAEGGLDPVSQE